MKNEIIISKMMGYLEKIQKYTRDISYEDFIKNDLLVEACVFNLSQLGEISNKADAAFQKENSQIPWHQLYGLRNRIVHDYEGVNLKLVWQIIREDLPELKDIMEKVQ